MQKIIAFIRNTILIWVITTLTLHAQVQKDQSLHLEVTGLHLTVKAYIPKGNSQFEIEIESDRNRKISRFTDISPHDKQLSQRKAQYDTVKRDFWYPVVDIEIEPGMEGVCVFTGDIKGTYIFGGPYYTERLPLSKEIAIPANKLENWENSLFVEPREGKEVKRFFLRKTFPVILREFSYDFKLLSEDWSGTVTLNTYTATGKVEIAKQRVQAKKQEWKDEVLEAIKVKLYRKNVLSPL